MNFTMQIKCQMSLAADAAQITAVCTATQVTSVQCCQCKKLQYSNLHTLSGVRVRLELTLEQASTPSEVSTSPQLKQMGRQMAPVNGLKEHHSTLWCIIMILCPSCKDQTVSQNNKYTTEGVWKAIFPSRKASQSYEFQVIL